MFRPQTFRRMARLLLLSMLFQAFLVSGAFARLEQGVGPHRVQICSASGLQWVDLNLDASEPASGTSPSHHDHCALCGSLAVDLPTTAFQFATIPGLHPPFIAACQQLEREHEAKLLPPSHAPPAML